MLRFDPEAETVHATSFRLPYGRQASSAVALGGFIYLFGGRSTMTALMTQIVRFDPTTGAMTPMNSVLPTGRYNMGAVAIGNAIFLIGGYDYTKVREIIRFDPATDSLAVLPTQLSPGLESPVAVPFGSAFFVLGGSDNSGQRAEILRFETSTGQLSVANSVLPYAAWQPAPLVIDGLGYLCGGDSVTSVISFDPASGQASTMQGVTLSGASAMSSCSAAVPGRGYIFGGYGPNGAFLDRIVRFAP
ncbi:MAG: kelch repeat-containing protein [Archangium sp.]|nr:kelch repeat-containing protein [Archangium sp.]MDP3569806.1 kelch repeat-containing protein [Archangium sp.]